MYAKPDAPATTPPEYDAPPMKLAILLHGGVDRTGENRVTPVFLWLLEPAEAEAYLRGEAERARATLDEFERIAAQRDPDTPKTRAYRTALELGLHTARARLAWAESALTAAARPRG